MFGIVKQIHDQILRTYPFLDKKERMNFEREANLLPNNPSTIKQVEGLLGTLNNPHAIIFKIKKLSNKIHKKDVSFKINNRILKIKISTWNSRVKNKIEKLIQFCANNQDKYDGIIIDVRKNGGGNSLIAHNLAGIFFKKDVIFGKYKQRDETGKLKTRWSKMRANEKIHINKPIIILISGRCFSSNELFLAPFKITKRAILIGKKTKGGSANPLWKNIIIEKKKYRIGIPRWRFFLKGKNKPIEITKIEPDIYHEDKGIEKFAENYLIKIIKQHEKHNI